MCRDEGERGFQVVEQLALGACRGVRWCEQTVGEFRRYPGNVKRVVEILYWKRFVWP